LCRVVQWPRTGPEHHEATGSPEDADEDRDGNLPACTGAYRAAGLRTWRTPEAAADLAEEGAVPEPERTEVDRSSQREPNNKYRYEPTHLRIVPRSRAAVKTPCGTTSSRLMREEESPFVGMLKVEAT
jgi:hypothetical protein